MSAISVSKQEEYYKALVDRDSKYIGIFYACVKTTSVFCIATCRARKPKAENVIYFPTFKEALQAGYRPCKICKPTENANEAPLEVNAAIALVKKHPKEKISDEWLRKESISPEMVRRWFKKNYGMTFHAFQRMYRINNAYKELKDGKKTSDAAFDQGYESLSGFGYTFKKVLGKSPSKIVDKNILLVNRLTTPLGPMLICASDRGLCMLEFTDRKMLETEFRDLQKLLNAEIIVGENKHTKQAKRELKEYFNGDRKSFDVALDAPGTDFQKQTWEALHQIKFGTTATYQHQAFSIDNPKAVRAVARANGMNRVSIIIPCHRIIGKDGKLTGYGGGIARKKWLLDFEKENKG